MNSPTTPEISGEASVPADEYLDDFDDFDVAIDLDDRFGSLEVRDDGNELVVCRTRRGARSSTEMLRFDRDQRLLRIFPHDQFNHVSELQIEAPEWNPDVHSAMSERFGLLHVVGLPAGFAAVYEYGLGIKRDYRDFVYEIEKYSQSTTIRFTHADREGLRSDNKVFWVGLERFARYCAAADRSRVRGRTAVRRVIDAESHNAIADLFDLARADVKYGRNAVINAVTEEVATGHVMDAGDRLTLVDQATLVASKVAREAPERFGRLRTDVELVSLEILIDQFEKGLHSHRNDEDHWQGFFAANQFALQQLFSMPIVVARAQAHVQAGDVDGRGSRIADFLCANTVTRSAVVVEIKTPGAILMEKSSYRGKGTAAVFPPHKHLSGSIAQVQSQMAAVPRDLAQRLHRTPELDIDAWNDIRGAVIAGRVMTLTDEQRESFLRYRAGLTTVTVLCFDELLERLQTLLVVLKTS